MSPVTVKTGEVVNQPHPWLVCEGALHILFHSRMVIATLGQTVKRIVMPTP